MSNIDLSALEAALAALPKRFPGPGGVAGVVKDGKVLAARAWGYADLDSAHLRIREIGVHLVERVPVEPTVGVHHTDDHIGQIIAFDDPGLSQISQAGVESRAFAFPCVRHNTLKKFHI